jgi:DNA mismatch repair protein MutS
MSSKEKQKSETPLMKQYYSIKAQYPGALLLFRVGDFYETFDEDARIASKILGIVLTKRSNGAAAETDLAGFPHHSLDVYLPKLVRAGQRVAICDQLEDPKMTKTIVKRGVTELVTPGVSYNDKVLESGKSNYLCSIFLNANQGGISFLDISTGEFLTAAADIETIKKLVHGFKPAEIIAPKSQQAALRDLLGDNIFSQYLEEWVYQVEYCQEKLCRQFNSSSLKGYGIAEMPEAIIAAGACLQYLDNTHHTQTSHIHGIQRIDENKYVWLDGFTIRNLELLQPIYPGGTPLLRILDQTKTPMGSRLLHNWLVLPLKEELAIKERLDIVEYFVSEPAKLAFCSSVIERVGDLQRLAGKISMGKINPREMLQLGRSLEAISELKEILADSAEGVRKITNQMNNCADVTARVSSWIMPEAPALVNKGSVIKNGIDAELDQLRQIAFGGKDYLLTLQRTEAERTGISSLKISYNNVFGYYLEVTNIHKDKVPADWIRKQTLTNAERYITPELKEYEDTILTAEDKIQAIEQRLYDELTVWIASFVPVIQLNAQLTATLDILVGFARLAEENKYSRPQINNGKNLNLIGCRHPVIEKQLPPEESYIPNDIVLNNSEQRIIILTGPNMSGKSAILRQTALAVILAQTGSFVPCDHAEIGIVDKIYTRVGASDNISLGESTFMVEMLETASILNNISDRSLILLDEIGRGTSTYDGVSLAWSIAEFLQSHPLKPKTLFATHYHELNELENKAEGIRNFHIEIREQQNRIVFLRKLKPGGSEHSFGIHVAQMAGIPNQVLLRATEILKNLEDDRSDISGKQTLKKQASAPVYQLNMFQAEDPRIKLLQEKLKSIDINAISPIDALLKLQELKLTVQN